MTRTRVSKTWTRERVPPPPEGKASLNWFGPGLLWMLSAVGTGSILFTPRVASVYGYDLLWLLIIVVFFMWVMIREMSRFTIVTGKTILDGMHTLPGPKNWAVWVIFLPQLCAAAIGIAGLAAIVGSAFAVSLPGSNTLYALAVVLLCVGLTTSGHYMLIERISRYMAIVLMGMAIFSAIAVFPELATIARGLAFRWPDEPDFYVIAPWVGTILAGSMGIIWFSYWTATRGYGGGLEGRERDDEKPAAEGDHRAFTSTGDAESTRVERLTRWVSVMSGAATLGVVGGLVVITAFMILGAELLQPEGVVPQGTDVALDLTRLFSEVWGEAGRYIILAAIVIALGGSVLANQDGWGRSFADMALILTRDQREIRSGWAYRALTWLGARTGQAPFARRNLKRFFILTVTGIFPAIIILLFEDPVKVMSASGIIAATHTPFIVLTALLVNLMRLPSELKPPPFYSVMMACSGLFYLLFAIVYLLGMAAGFLAKP
ncbi:Nramp family divalent metal transporter [Halomonas sp. TRM85114]|uniref:Nramp family divalent metal transporter n=1 Tax=Halomonas jincaotanensis TaxID=2810616 RepID=UPI001BD488B8|nr:Nramp family divalent metal transporter [Halomonas jincaotanensis]MBS9404134.1 Nramp family divalent metal transporter [Halomonas jincaotanensis]